LPSERQPIQGGQLLLEISNAIVRVYRDCAGKGPSSCKAYWAGRDSLLVMMRGGFSVAEQMLYEGGHGNVVRESWHKLQDLLEGRLTAMVAELSGREVIAFMSSTHQGPDLMAQVFVLAPGDREGSRADEADKPHQGR